MHYQVDLTDWSEDKVKEFVESPWFDYDETRSIRGEPTCRYGYSRSHYESEKFLCIHRYSKLLERENVCVAIINAVTYRDSKIITQESVVEYLDYDPSENHDWSWEDYE